MYDITGTPRLERILTASDCTILSIAWCPHDPNIIAMALAEDSHNIVLWDVAAEMVTKRLSAIAQPAKYLAWYATYPLLVLCCLFVEGSHRCCSTAASRHT